MKLVRNNMIRLFGVSKKPDKSGKFKLVPFDNDAFNKEFDAAKIENMLSDLTKALYPFEEGRFGGSRWFQVCPPDEYDEDAEEVSCIEFDVYKRLEILDITDLIDVDSGIFQYFILVNGTHTEYQWVVASMHIVYSGNNEGRKRI